MVAVPFDTGVCPRQTTRCEDTDSPGDVVIVEPIGRTGLTGEVVAFTGFTKGYVGRHRRDSSPTTSGHRVAGPDDAVASDPDCVDAQERGSAPNSHDTQATEPTAPKPCTGHGASGQTAASANRTRSTEAPRTNDDTGGEAAGDQHDRVRVGHINASTAPPANLGRPGWRVAPEEPE